MNGPPIFSLTLVSRPLSWPCFSWLQYPGHLVAYGWSPSKAPPLTPVSLTPWAGEVRERLLTKALVSFTPANGVGVAQR
jgi:hypothetical protein